jgi:S-methylmethionine-dependent homocysteine/selenocysteine methylase
MGSELRRRGFELSSPLFSSAACLSPEGVALVRAIHTDFLRAGAQSLRSNSFPLLSAVPEIGIERACEIAAASVRIAHNAIQVERAAAWVTGCIGPAKDAKREDMLAMARALLDAGADSILVETCTTKDMVDLACSLRMDLDEDLAVSLTLDAEGRLLDGTSLEDWSAPDKVPDVLALNCTELPHIEVGMRAVTRLAHNWGVPRTGLWPSASGTNEAGEFVQSFVSPPDFAKQIAAVVEKRSSIAIVGGCCGAQPAHLLALLAAL